MRLYAMSVASNGQVALALLVSLATLAGIAAVPTSVLADSKETNGHHDGTAPGLNQLTSDDTSYGDAKPEPSNPQKRGVNPLLYRETELRNDYSGNSIPQNGIWEDLSVPVPGLPLSGYPLGLSFEDELAGLTGSSASRPERTYDVLQRLLLHRNQPFNGPPVSGGGDAGYPLRLHGYGNRKKRTPVTQKSHNSGLRLKRNTNKLSPAEVFSLLALMDSRDPYHSLQPLPDYLPDAPPGDMLAYVPNGLYQDIPLPLALERLLAERNEVSPSDDFAYEDGGEWMNGWTEPSVDYLGLPLADLDALGQLGEGFIGKSSNVNKNVYLPQKRFMVAKKKRSTGTTTQAATGSGCKTGDGACNRYGTIQAAA
ncbi:uncharacterized protein LOC126571290 [Anopheles aquasalis]|uniref:uncharacterized protein LOC126571290 n=1 Tax=Anopheles aquasalis TaxID=42839 RepID=UPI00215A1308|nr:uncharacterized protein LOC126571290 [Anopheles aquasalis]XP_050085615.1 uncharacterized protein LOC126571290 [Anopheles aquasalis]